MKLTSIHKALIVTFVAILTLSCNDTLDQVGFSIQPGKDRLTVGIDTLFMQARTVQVDSIYAKTKYPVLGEYIDPVFGSVKSDYIGEFYFPQGAGFKTGATIDSVRVVVSYSTMMGDSLAPMELSVYEVTKSLEGVSNYTHNDPEAYADMSAPLGREVFTGKNSTYRTETYSSGYTSQEYKVYDINVKLPDELGEKFLNEYNKAGHGKMVDADSFREFFPGLYFTTSFGNSTMLNVSFTSLYVHYHYLDVKGSSTQQDTIRKDAMRLFITPEVTQLNHVSNNNDQLLVENATHTYVKSPAGVNTEVTFPLSQIYDKMKSQALNLAKFTIFAMPDAIENPMVKLSPPDYLLLVNRDSLDGFFENKKLPDNVTSFLSAKFDATTYSYNFNNISTMINHYNETSDGVPFDLVYYLIPVDATIVTSQQSYYSSGSQSLTDVSNQMWPTAAMLDKREGNLKLELIFSNF
ncbi:MAG: DUF4270 domain-containing protein [Bacteroidales bacterium]|jgi:hypothetical protein|nr:DUF4270 domain-containing protein [Bacteroidales bacterium]